LNGGGPVVRIAHAFGNRREMLSEALAAPEVDAIEADMWFRRGRVEIRHERRLGWLPLLADKRPRGVPHAGPLTLPLPGRRYVRLDVQRLLLDELLATVADRRALLLDAKMDDTRNAEAFASEMARAIEAAGAGSRVSVCGSWPVLDRLREAAPAVAVRYTLDRPEQWDVYMDRLTRGEVTAGVCIYYRMVDDERAAVLKERGVETYCWTVDDADVAAVLVGRGVDGVISNDLGLLASLR
jgi:glycerophosphoryl diester phosphodiesterase